MAPVLPPPQDYAEYIPAKGGPVWRAAGDVRLLGLSGYATLLQVAHPTVGAGVGDHSMFTKDPWGRLYRTLDYVHGSIYGGPELAGSIGRRVRAMHRTITGTRPDGERYHALEPEAYAWVHATLASAFVDGHRVFGRAMSRPETEAFYTEWLRLGRLIGVRERDLPASWADFGPYFDATVRDVLVDNPTVHVVLDALRSPQVPPGLPRRAWSLLHVPLSKQLELTTVGMLPPILRERCGLPWSPTRDRAFRAAAALSRAGDPLIVGPLREFGPHYLRWRREALARGDVARPGSRSPATPEPVAASG
jgi:uncharacterized protein (DUF2236 family)